MIDVPLSNIYTYCLRQPLIRELFLIGQSSEEEISTSYELILFVSDLTYFASHFEWLEAFGPVLHAQQDFSFTQSPP